MLKGGGRTGGKEESKITAAQSLLAKGTMKTRGGCHGGVGGKKGAVGC